MGQASDNELLKTVHRIQTRFIEGSDPRDVFGNLLEELLRLTESEYGFIGEILHEPDGTPFLKTHAITDITWNDETRAFFEKHAAGGLEFHDLETLYGAVITTGEAVVANDPANDPRSGGLPPEHPDLNHFLGVPLHCRDAFTGMVGVANRPGGYSHEMVPRLEPFLASCGSIIRAYSHTRRRTRTEMALRDSEQRYRSLVEDQSALICRFKPDGELTFVNRAYAEFFGKTIEECDGLNLFGLIPEADRESVREHFESLGPERPFARIEHEVITPDEKTRWIQWTDRILSDDSGAVLELQSIGLDVTERRRGEDERRSLEEQIRQVQKLESLGVLAGGIAHDFNNLLTGILGNANLAMLDLPEESPVRGNLEQIEMASLRAAELCRQMLAYSGKGRFRSRVLDLSRVVEEMTQILEVSISKKALLELSLADDPPLVEGDHSQIQQVVLNLIVNASDAIGDDEGRIEVATGVRHCDRTLLSETYLPEDLPEGPYVYVRVSDTGCGIDTGTLAKIFDPFFTTKFAGRGLGLAVVLGIVRGHKGAIKLESEPGRGTTVWAFLPASAESSATADEVNEGVLPEAGHGTILVVDDEAAVRNFARKTLERLGFEVVDADDGRRALEIFSERPEAFTAVLLDLTMPHKGGDEVFQEMRRIDGDVRVVLSSGYTEHETMERFVGEGLAGFIEKPYKPADLAIAIAAAVNGA